MDRQIVEYGIEDKKSMGLYIEDGYSVYEDICNHKEEIEKKIRMGSVRSIVPLTNQNDSNVNDIEFYENGLVIKIQNTIPSDANKYDDFAGASMFIFNNGEVHYVFHKVDSRINNGNDKVNEELLKDMYSKMGQRIPLSYPEKKTLFNRGKVREQEERMNECLNRFSSLVTPIERQKTI
jgi:hypothetical protein